MEALVKFDGEDFLCRYFFDIDNQAEGLEVYYLGNNTLVGIIDGKTLPDEHDEEDVRYFNQSVQVWLGHQDINYTMG